MQACNLEAYVLMPEKHSAVEDSQPFNNTGFGAKIKIK